MTSHNSDGLAGLVTDGLAGLVTDGLAGLVTDRRAGAAVDSTRGVASDFVKGEVANSGRVSTAEQSIRSSTGSGDFRTTAATIAVGVALSVAVEVACRAAPSVASAITQAASHGFGVRKLTGRFSRKDANQPTSPEPPAPSASDDASPDPTPQADSKIHLDVGAFACIRVSAQVSGLDLWSIYDTGRDEADAYLREMLAQGIGPLFATSVYTMKADHEGLLVVALIRLSAENAAIDADAVGRPDAATPSPKPAPGASEAAVPRTTSESTTANEPDAAPVLDGSKVPSAVTKLIGRLLNHNRQRREPAVECTVGIFPDIDSQVFQVIAGVCAEGFDPARALPAMLEYRQTDQQKTMTARVVWKSLSWRVDGDDQATVAPTTTSEQVSPPD